MKKIFITALFVVFIIVTLISIFLNKSSNTTNNKSQITTSIYPIYFFTSQITGNRFNITNITPPGAEPHDYDLTPQDIIKIENSKLLILNGNIEPWTKKITSDLKNKNTQILIAGENLVSSDPHVWLSPKLAKIESQKILSTIINIDPANSDYYKNNELTLENELDKIDKNYQTGLSNCETKSFVTSHAAFGYLAKDYNLTQIAVNGLSPDEEPSLSKLAEITNFAKSNNVKYIFFESLVSPKLSQTIANEVGAKTLILDPIEGITNKNNTYLTLMESNLQNLRTALQCNK